MADRITIIERGRQGPQGPEGPQGLQGPEGPAGNYNTLAELNTDIADATLDDTNAPRTPTLHATRHAVAGSDAITPADIGAATVAQGSTADTAVQPGDLAAVATSGAYADLSGQPPIPTTALPVPFVLVTESKTLALSDSEVEQRVNSASAVVLTIPTNATVAFADNAKIPVMGIGTGTVTITASAGVSINGVSAGSATLSAQYSAVVMTKVGADAWVINGDRGAVA